MDAEIQMSLAADLARLADAAERIAAALGDQHQDDEYEYLSVGLVAAHDAFQDGWRLWRVIGGELFMRRPRTQEVPEPAIKVGNYVIVKATGERGRVVTIDTDDDLYSVEHGNGMIYSYADNQIALDQIPF